MYPNSSMATEGEVLVNLEEIFGDSTEVITTLMDMDMDVVNLLADRTNMAERELLLIMMIQ